MINFYIIILYICFFKLASGTKTCYCNQAECVRNNYLCKSTVDLCYSKVYFANLLPASTDNQLYTSYILPLPASDLVYTIHGCVTNSDGSTDTFGGKRSIKICGSGTEDGGARTYCCSENMCNYPVGDYYTESETKGVKAISISSNFELAVLFVIMAGVCSLIFLFTIAFRLLKRDAKFEQDGGICTMSLDLRNRSSDQFKSTGQSTAREESRDESLKCAILTSYGQSNSRDHSRTNYRQTTRYNQNNPSNKLTPRDQSASDGHLEECWQNQRASVSGGAGGSNYTDAYQLQNYANEMRRHSCAKSERSVGRQFLAVNDFNFTSRPSGNDALLKAAEFFASDSSQATARKEEFDSSPIGDTTLPEVFNDNKLDTTSHNSNAKKSILDDNLKATHSSVANKKNRLPPFGKCRVLGTKYEHLFLKLSYC